VCAVCWLPKRQRNSVPWQEPCPCKFHERRFESKTVRWRVVAAVGAALEPALRIP
jgi:hypothetical protein